MGSVVGALAAAGGTNTGESEGCAYAGGAYEGACEYGAADVGAAGARLKGAKGAGVSDGDERGADGATDGAERGTSDAGGATERARGASGAEAVRGTMDSRRAGDDCGRAAACVAVTWSGGWLPCKPRNGSSVAVPPPSMRLVAGTDSRSRVSSARALPISGGSAAVVTSSSRPLIPAGMPAGSNAAVVPAGM